MDSTRLLTGVRLELEGLVTCYLSRARSLSLPRSLSLSPPACTILVPPGDLQLALGRARGQYAHQPLEDAARLPDQHPVVDARPRVRNLPPERDRMRE